MTSLLTGLWVGVLVFQLVRFCRRRSAAELYKWASIRIGVLPVIIVLPAPPVGQPEADAEAWLRRQLEGLGTP